MLVGSPQGHQENLFYTDLMLQLDQQDPLLRLGRRIDWRSLEKDFAQHYHSTTGRPCKPIRLMTGLLILKQVENLSDEAVVVQVKRNPYYQAFCGYTEFQQRVPCDATELVHFRKRIGTEGVTKILALSIQMHGKAAEEKEVIVDTTVQEKAITYPTDAKLAIKIIHRLIKLARVEGIGVRRTYAKEVKSLRIDLRFFRHVKKRKKATRALKRLRTIAHTLLRELERKLPDEKRQAYEEGFAFYRQALTQQRHDKDKIYSLHEPAVCCIAKGKDHTPYEYGSKVSIVTAKTSGVILGVVNHQGNPNDSQTLETALDTAMEHRDQAIACALCDRGYRGRTQIGEIQVCLPGKPKRSDTAYQKRKKSAQCRRRSAIEPIIGHLKSDHRLSRNYLKGTRGDQINLTMAAAAWNFRLWMRRASFFVLFWRACMQRFRGLRARLALFTDWAPREPLASQFIATTAVG